MAATTYRCLLRYSGRSWIVSRVVSGRRKVTLTRPAVYEDISISRSLVPPIAVSRHTPLLVLLLHCDLAVITKSSNTTLLLSAGRRGQGARRQTTTKKV